MMTHDPVTLYDSYYLIDTQAWLDQRVGADQPQLTAPLRAFTGGDVFDDLQCVLPMADRMRLWCAANDLLVAEGRVLEHDSEVLTRSVAIVLAAGTGSNSGALALVSVDDEPPHVYADTTTDADYWLEHTRIEIACPGGRSFIWDGGPSVSTADGVEHRATTLFGGPVIGRCRDCAAADEATTPTRCPCPGVAIYCPACGHRAQVRLPAIPARESRPW